MTGQENVSHAESFTPTPFARALTAHMRAWRSGYDGSSHPIFTTWLAGIHPELRDGALAAVKTDGVTLHEYAGAITG